MIRWLKRAVVSVFDTGLRTWAWAVTVRFDHRLPSYYRDLAGGEAMGVRKQPLRGADIIVQLRRHSPRNIWELGSGSSTGVFASYASTRGARSVTVEHSDQWRNVTLAALERAGLATDAAEVVLAPTRLDERGVGYAIDVPDDVDFVYVDGPPTKDKSGRVHPCIDVLDALDRGARPRVILVDGRDPTLAALRGHSVVAAEYDVQIGQRSRHAKLPSWRDRLRFRPHHVLVRRPPSDPQPQATEG